MELSSCESRRHDIRLEELYNSRLDRLHRVGSPTAGAVFNLLVPVPQNSRLLPLETERPRRVGSLYRSEETSDY